MTVEWRSTGSAGSRGPSPAPRSTAQASGGRGERPRSNRACSRTCSAYDSVHGRLDEPVTVTDDSIEVAGGPSASAREGSWQLPWGQLDVDVVVESTGVFTDATKAPPPTSPRVPAGC